jgi:hypothetical protein
MFYQLWRFWWWISHLAVQEPFAFASAVLSGATLFIVLVQLRLMKQQTSLMGSQASLASRQAEIADTQLDIMRRQDEITAADRARRARLEVSALAEHGDQTVRLHVKNSGNRAAHGFYWHLAIPVDIMQENQVWLGGNVPLPSTDIVQFEDRSCQHFRGYQREPLFPTRQILIASFGINPSAPRGAQLFFWSTTCEDGKNPEAETDMTRSTITIGA